MINVSNRVNNMPADNLALVGISISIHYDTIIDQSQFVVAGDRFFPLSDHDMK